MHRVIIALVLYLVALALLAPATFLAWIGSELSEGHIEFHDVVGGFWSGQASQLEFRPKDKAAIVLDQVVWDINPFRYLSGTAPIRFENKSGEMKLDMQITPVMHGVRLTNLHVDAQLSTLSHLLTTGIANNMTGELNLESPDIQLAGTYQGGMTGELQVASGNLPHGIYNLTFTGVGQRMNIRWTGPRGPNSMRGQGWWNGNLHLDGVIGNRL